MSRPWDETFELILRPHLPYLDQNDELGAAGALSEQGLDSLETVHLLIELEDHYRVTFPDESLNPGTFATPEALWEVIRVLLDEAERVRTGSS